MGIPEDKVKIVVMAYWNDIYKKLITGSNTAITVRHVGTFGMSRFKLKNNIKKRIAQIKGIEKSTRWEGEEKKQIIEEQKMKLRKALKHRNEIAINYAKNFGNI